MRFSILVLALVAACGSKKPPPSNTSNTADPKVSTPADAVTCKTDADCPESLACGPCEAGTVLTATNHHPECVVNPCGKSVRSACTNGVCTVQ